MRIDMRFDRLQFEFFDKGFELQRVHLLPAALFNEMIKIIDQDPGQNKQTIIDSGPQEFIDEIQFAAACRIQIKVITCAENDQAVDH